VPLHRIVLEAGFRDYLDRVAHSGREALFPALERDGHSKKTREFSKWFNQKLVLPHFPCCRCGIMRPGGRGRGGVRSPPGRTSSA
jgi:hypothetical protein